MRYRNDENVKNISYINKDFPAIWQELLELIPKLTNEWNPAEANESDPLAVLLKLLAIYSDKLNYNVDVNILEAFPNTLTQQRSAYNLYDILGYNPRWYRSALTYVNFTVLNTLTSEYYLPKFTRISDDKNNIIYTTLQDALFKANTKTGYQDSILSIEGEVNDYTINGVEVITLANLDGDNKLYFTETNIAQNGIFISSTADFNVNVTPENTLLGDWRQVNNVYQAGSEEKVFRFGIDPVSGTCYVQFPDSIANLIGAGLYIKYVTSSGLLGNIKSNTLTKFAEEATKLYPTDSEEETLEAKDYLAINNLEAATNGADPESISDMYKNYQKVKNVFETLITLLDYENFIYAYTKGDGTHVVSNIKAADRNNDLYDAFKIQTLDLIEGPKIVLGSRGLMNAYNLRFYPLQPVESVSTDSAFLKSFQSVTTETRNTWKGGLNDVIRDAKAINHDQLDPGAPILVDYDIVGEIYLNERVSAQTAQQILGSIKAALRNKLNARELAFGQPISYRDVLDTIQGADSRIDYVALQPIQYTDTVNLQNLYYANSSDISPAFDIANVNSTILSTNIMAGSLPWAKYDDRFKLRINQENAQTDTLNTSAQFTVESVINTGAAANNSVFTLTDNEVLSLLAPSYQDDIIYSNYLYFRPVGIDEITEDVMYKLSGSQAIYFYETLEDYRSADPNYALNALYVLRAGDIVKFNFDYISTGDIISLNQGRTITKLKESAGPLSVDSNIQFFTNAKSIFDDLDLMTGSYILKAGEYFLYRLTDSAGFTILGEGTTLTFSGNTLFSSVGSQNNYIQTLDSLTLDWEQLSQGYVSQSSALNDLWLPNAEYSGNINLPGSDILYCINQIMIFSSNYSFRYAAGNNSSNLLQAFNNQSGWFFVDNNSYISNASVFFNASRINVNDTEYVLQFSEDPTFSSYSTLPLLPNTGDVWKGFLVLNVDGVTNNSIALKYVNTPGTVPHTQTLIINNSSSSSVYSPDVTNNPLYIQTNPAISTNGLPLTLSNIITNIDVYSYTLNTSISNSTSEFIRITGDTWTNLLGSPVIIPYHCVDNISIDGQLIANSITENNSIRYIYMENGTNVSTLHAGELTLGVPQKVNPDDKFGVNLYLNNSSAANISTFSGTVVNDPDMAAEFNYTYIPNPNELLDTSKPLSGQSFLNSNNVYNSFVLPKLNYPSGSTSLLSNLKISNFSIK